MRQAPRLLPGEQPGRDASGAMHAAERREDVALERSVDGAKFNAFFGFEPTHTDNAMAINGDDAIELFHDTGSGPPFIRR